MFSRPKILFLVSLLFVALLNPKFNPYLLFNFLSFLYVQLTLLFVYSIEDRHSLAWPDRFFPFLFVVAEKRVWSGLQTHLVLTPSNVLINCIINSIINTLVYSQKHEMWQTSLDF